MELRGNGTRFDEYYKWEAKTTREYDYAKHGLLNRIMSPAIVNTTNPLLQVVLQFIESSLVFTMKYVDILKNFKNIHWKNR